MCQGNLAYGEHCSISESSPPPPPPPPMFFSSTQMEKHHARVMISIGSELSETTEQFLTDHFSYLEEKSERHVLHLHCKRMDDVPREGPTCQTLPLAPGVQTDLHRTSKKHSENPRSAFQTKQHHNFPRSCALTAGLHALLWREEVSINTMGCSSISNKLTGIPQQKDILCKMQDKDDGTVLTCLLPRISFLHILLEAN